jgi:hypothetical protein
VFTIKGSTATSRSPHLRERPRASEEPGANAAWFREEVQRLDGEADDGIDEATYVLLFGGRSSAEFRVRVAQSHLRSDLSPGFWSHAALVWAAADPPARTALLECPLEPAGGFRDPVAGNGLHLIHLSWYADPATVPNIAVLRVPVPAARWRTPPSEGERSLVGHFARQRVLVDVPALVLRWLAFVWGVGAAGNPLLDGAGLPSAVMIVSGAGFDLSPGVDSQTSTPEAFWQAATWWHPYFEALGKGRLTGSWCATDWIDLAPARRRDDGAAHVPAQQPTWD